MGGDITTFKNIVAGYKSTITIALADTNMQVRSGVEVVLDCS